MHPNSGERSSDGPRIAANEAAQLVELRVLVASLTSEVSRLRSDIAPIGGLPAQLEHVARLWDERLRNAISTHDRDVAELREDVAGLREWQTWALRLVVGAVVVSILALLGSTR